MFGWVQLVRSTDSQSGGQLFELDPFVLFGDVRSSYCWYGTEPTLFDAPYRQARVPIEWIVSGSRWDGIDVGGGGLGSALSQSVGVGEH